MECGRMIDESWFDSCFVMIWIFFFFAICIRLHAVFTDSAFYSRYHHHWAVWMNGSCYYYDGWFLFVYSCLWRTYLFFT